MVVTYRSNQETHNKSLGDIPRTDFFPHLSRSTYLTVKVRNSHIFSCYFIYFLSIPVPIEKIAIRRVLQSSRIGNYALQNIPPYNPPYRDNYIYLL